MGLFEAIFGTALAGLDQPKQLESATDRRARPAPNPDPWRAPWKRFVESVTRRLRSGQEDYGDRSFSADPVRLLREVQEELEDVAGWSFILWHRLEAARRALEGVQLPPRDEEVVL